MRRGVAMEPLARAAYAAATGQFVHTTGFVAHPTLMAGASLDGHVGAGDRFEGIVEIKAPNTATHLHWKDHVQRAVNKRHIPRQYQAQITHQLWLTGAAWADFVSWDDRVPEPKEHALLVVRVWRDEAAIAEYDALVRGLLAEVESIVAVTRFFTTADLRLAREVFGDCSRTLAGRGGITLPRIGGVA
jgi:hypothetical protein